MLTAAALLHPKIQPHAIEPFRNSSCDIEFREDVENTEHLDAVLIFGGDGTVHRFKLKLLACIPTVFFGAHLGIREVEYFQAPEIRLDADPPLEIYADGEYACLTPATARLLPRALRVIIPA
jgi:diacylglycerol kinase family enzyme